MCKIYIYIFFPEYETFLFRSTVFSRALGCGARIGPVCTRRCKCGSRPGSVTRALGVQSSEIWQVSTGSLSAELEPSKTMENPHFKMIFWFCAPLLCCCICCMYHTSPPNVYALTQPRYNSSRASSVSLCDNHEQCFCVCVSVCVCAIELIILQQAVGTNVPGIM